MKRFKLGFRNKSIPAQLAICRRVADGIGRLPVEAREAMKDHNLGPLTDGAAVAVARVESLRAEMRAAKADRAAKVRAARTAASYAATSIRLRTDGDPARALAAGLE
ncbi:MAG TPA: hypothetical protein VI454_20450, partial [Verrucomicrobiae bacterium]